MFPGGIHRFGDAVRDDTEGVAADKLLRLQRIIEILHNAQCGVPLTAQPGDGAVGADFPWCIMTGDTIFQLAPFYVEDAGNGGDKKHFRIIPYQLHIHFIEDGVCI